MHLIIFAKENNVSDVLCNFKKFTSKKLIAAIQNNTSESRKEWMINYLKKRENQIVAIAIFNSGNRIMNLKSFTRPILLNRN